MYLVRRRLDELKSKTKAKQDQLDATKSRLGSLLVEEKANQAEVKGKNKDPMRKVRILENRLDKAMLKYNEAIGI